jgi:hypothetical protein
VWDPNGPPTPTPVAQAEMGALADLRRSLAASGDKVEVLLREFLSDKLEARRAVALVCLGAIDDVPAVLDALNNDDPDRAGVRQGAVFVLRRWVSNGPAHGRKLFDPKTKTGWLADKGYSPREAELIVHLLRQTFGREFTEEKETYAALIAYLRHDRLAVRELALWFLTRLAPALAQIINYNAAAPPIQREVGYEAWKKALTDGKLPPAAPKPPPKRQSRLEEEEGDSPKPPRKVIRVEDR